MLAERGSRIPSLDWAASRFELGAERGSLIEALSDYLLALRGLLEGGGPARTSMSARVAALACEPHEREQGRVTVERALAIERKLMSGGRYRPVAGASPLDVIAELEELLRRLLKGLATGELGGDLRAAADEVLLSDGLSATHVETPGIGETAEWRLPDPTARRGARSLGDLRRPPGRREIEVHRITRSGAQRETETRRRRTKWTICPSAGARRIGRPTTRIVVDDVELPEIMGAESDHRASTPPDDSGIARIGSRPATASPSGPRSRSPRRKDARRGPRALEGPRPLPLPGPGRDRLERRRAPLRAQAARS